MAQQQENRVVSPATTPGQAAYHDNDKHVMQLNDMEKNKHFEDSNQRKLFCWTMSKRKCLIVILCGAVVSIIVILLLVAMIFGKSIAQGIAEDVKFEMNYVDWSVLDPSDKNANTHLGMNMSLHVEHNAPMDTTMEESEITLLYKGQALGTSVLPAHTFRSSNKKFDMSVQSMVKVTNPEVFTQLGVALVNDEEVEVMMNGKFSIKASILHYSGIKITKPLKFKGMNKFSNPVPKVNKIDVPECGAAFNMVINVSIDNPSQISFLNLGQLNMSVFYQNKFISTAVSEENTNIPRSLNNYIFKTAVPNKPETLVLMLPMFMDIMAKKPVTFHISGDNPNVIQNELLKSSFKVIQMDIVYSDGMQNVVLDPKCLSQFMGSNPDMLSNLLGGKTL